MNYSRKQLYAFGEPLGDSSTRTEGGRKIYGGGGSSSSSSNTTQTKNTDKRLVVNSGVGVSSDSSTVNVTNTSLDPQIVNHALDVVSASDATNGVGFTQLLALSDKLFSGAGQVIHDQNQAVLGQVSAINTTANNAKGAIDQKTLIIIVAGAAVAIFALKGGKL